MKPEFDRPRVELPRCRERLPRLGRHFRIPFSFASGQGELQAFACHPRRVALCLILGFLFCLVQACVRPPKPPESMEPTPLPVTPPQFSGIDSLVEDEIARGRFPGAVVLVGHQGRTAYAKAFGRRSLRPRVEPMTMDTVFDIASLTKVVATAPAIMQLIDQGRLGLDDPIGHHWPEFASNGKEHVTTRQLLTHTSGLRAGLNPKARWEGYEGALSLIARERPASPPGTSFRYSDLNFIVLGELVQRVSGEKLDRYCADHIFRPLGMQDTAFRPLRGDRARTAPSDVQQGELRHGEVQDPTACRMGGVAGHAGVFSTAHDLALFARTFVDGGVSRDRRPLLSPAATAAMTRPQTNRGVGALRGLGWDIQSPYSREHDGVFPGGSFGHTGYTGCSIWVYPPSGTFLIILTNRLHPDGRGQVKPLRAQVAGAVASELHWGPPPASSAPSEGALEAGEALHGQSDEPSQVRTGIDVLASTNFASLRGRKVGLITNHTGADSSERSTIRLLADAPGVQLRTLFNPEHGLTGRLDRSIASGTDPATGLPVYSLYGDVKRPSAEMLRGLDTLVYDIQDVGVRYYTYITTLGYAMEAARDSGLDFMVLDRPSPITATAVQGPILDPDLKSFVGYFPLPVRYGMTPGELAQLFNREVPIGARLRVVPMEGYRRNAWFEETGLPWADPSPNIRSVTQAALYTGVGLVESANVSVGRGTATPFEVVGAPWISADRMSM
ncbi:MAG: DUF1343 domain-containing protein, partial [Syntrophobacteraceae bacterium]|nr:DUF1343 domain-containing protein [Syntrophobacteraceae bacterium]